MTPKGTRAGHHADPALTFIEVAEPPGSWLAKYHRVTWFLLYLHWLDRAYDVGRRLHAQSPFAAVHHATYSTYWLPTPAVKFGVPCIWGPVGGAVTTPLSLWPALGWRGIPGELLDRLAVRLMSALPSTRQTWRRATRRLVQNEATLERLPPDLRGDTLILNHAMFTEVPPQLRRDGGNYCVMVGSLEPRKGHRLAVHALAHAPSDVRLVIVGDGPRRAHLQRLARRLGVADRVEFWGRRPRQATLEILSGAAAAVFTGLREEGGIALAEALLCGVPAVVLANGGAATIAAAATDPERVALVPAQSFRATAVGLAAAMTRFTREPAEGRGPMLDQVGARAALRSVFEQALTGGQAPSPLSPR